MFQANRDHGASPRERGLRPRVLANTEGDDVGEGGQGLLGVGRGRGTQQHAVEGKNKSEDGFRPIARVQGRKGDRGEVRETEDVTWGPRDSQVLFKYEGIKGIVHNRTEV